MVVMGTAMASVESSSAFGAPMRLIPSAPETNIVAVPDEDPTAACSMPTIRSKPLNCTCAVNAWIAIGFGSNATTLPLGPVQCDNCKAYAPTLAPTSKQIAPDLILLLRKCATSAS